MNRVPKPLLISWLLILAAYAVHLGLLPFQLGPFDYNHLSAYYDLALRFWQESPGLPHFNPYFCGGRTLGGDPQIPIFHPLVFLVSVLGPVWTLKWEILLQIAMGLWGLELWLRRWKIPVEGRLWGQVLFAGGGFTVAHAMVGHVTLGFYFLMPLYFYLSYLLCDPKSPGKTTTAIYFFALLIYCTLYKPNFLIYAAPTLIFESIFRSAASKSFRPILLLTFGLFIATLVCSVSLLPASSYFAEFPRNFDTKVKFTPLFTLVASLVLPLKGIPENWYGTAFMQRHEYSVFLGPVALFFAARALRSASLHRAEKLSLIAFGFIGAWLGLGASSKELTLLSPYTWLEAFWPGFESIRVPVRFWYGTFLCLIVFSAEGFLWPKRNFQRIALSVLGLAPVVFTASINLGKITWLTSQNQWNPPRASNSQFTQVHSIADYPYSNLRAGEGVLECVQNVQAMQAPGLKPGALLETTSEKPISFHAKWLRWNQFRVWGKSESLNRISLNLNSHPYWRVSGKNIQLVTRTKEPLSLEVGAGSFEADVEFHQPMLAQGLVLSLCTLALLLAWATFVLRKARRPRRIGLTGGIGTGKTTVAEILRKRGWVAVDLDAEARRLTDSDPVIGEKLRLVFGPSIYRDGKLDRARIRETIFHDELKRRELERLLHPALMAAFELRYRQAAKDGVRAVVCEAALLVESGYNADFDRLIVVTAPIEIRRERIKARDGVTDAQVDAILKAQTDDAERISKADYVVHNKGDVAELENEINRIVPKF